MPSYKDHRDILAFDRVIVIFGGIRGLSRSLLNIYLKNNYFVVILSRNAMYESLPPESCKVIALDIDSHNTIVPTLDKLISFLVDSNFSEIQTHILYGGSLAASVNQDESELNKLTRVFHHNSIVPMFITQYMIRHLVNSQNSRSIHFCYYLSAVTQHLKASPDYVGAKAALEGILRAFVFKQIPNTYFSGFRLGIVPIDHKYLGKLRMEDSDSYREIS